MSIFVAIILLRLDFSKSDFSPGDLFSMLSSSAIIYLFFLCALLLVINKFVSNRFSVLIPLLLVAILGIVFPLLQYPSIHSWDSFLHGLTANIIKESGHIPSDTGYFVYPGAFELSAVFSQITGCSVVEAEIILSSLLKFSMIFFLLLVGRIIVNRGKSWLVPTVFFAFYLQFFTGLLHYCPQMLGFCLYVLLIYVITKKLYSTITINREIMIPLFILLSALIIVHPFSAFVAVITLSCIYAVGSRFQSPLRLRNRQPISFLTATFSCFIFTSWHLFVAQVYFESSIRSFFSTLQHGRSSSFFDVLIYNPPPSVLTRILAYYRYGVYGFFGALSFLCIILFWRREEVKLIILLLFGAVLETIAIYFTPSAYGVGRLIIFGGVQISLLTSYLIKNLRTSILSKTCKVLEMIIPFLVVGSFLTANLYVSSYILFMHTDEMNAAQFVAVKVEKPITSIIDDALLINFFSGGTIPLQIINKYLPIESVNEMLNKANVSLQYLPRQKYYYNLNFVESYNNLVYSNGLSHVYTKTNFNGTNS